MKEREPNGSTRVIGTPRPKHDAGIRVSGRAVYGHDIELPGMLHGAILRAEHPSATFTIDAAEARRLPGVACVITAADVRANPIGYKRDHPVLKSGEVNCIRDEIAAVAAETPEIAQQALRLIKVRYRPRKGVFDPEEALKERAPRINRLAAGKFGHPNIAEVFHYAHGDMEGERKRSAVVVNRRFTLPRVTHACMATSNITASWDPVTGRLLLYSSTQVPFLYQRDMAHALGLEPSAIRIIQPVIGGGFGSKLDMYPFEPICALLSMHCGRPVRLLFTRREEFVASPTRQPMLIDITAGADAQGRFTFREVNVLKDNGAYTSWGATTPFVMMQTFSSLYRVPHCDYHTAAVYTNNPYAGSFRGYGNLQATFAIEQHMDMLAEAIGMDPLEFRMKNAQDAGEVTGQGMSFKSCGFKECITTAATRSDFSRKFAENRANQKKPGNIKRGIGMASMLHVGGGAKIYPSDGCGTILKMDDFANVTLITGASEIGQGSETVLSQLVCEELGLPISAITVVNNDTAITPWDVGVHASRTTFIAGNSAIGAAKKAKGKILAVAAKKFDCTEADLDLRGGFVIRAASGEALVELSKLLRNLHFQEKAELVMTTFYYEPPSVHQDKGFKGDVSAAYAWGNQVVEIEVDTDTGFIRLLKVTGAHDVGRVLNRLGIEGQIEGGVVMGQGYAFTEDLMIEDGKMKNPNFRDYKLVTAPEIPEMDIAFIESMDGEGPQGAKGVGEAPSICMAAAAANAIANATGTRMFELPFTPEKVYRALHGQTPKRYWKPWKAE